MARKLLLGWDYPVWTGLVRESAAVFAPLSAALSDLVPGTPDFGTVVGRGF